ncbi:hypothetical protein DUNSADRAFT_10482 [Dunaliella salina]|uniref:Encoded protein n=1 Tax=Dunaliella salina TaxID=3046 RepID=A0ABQ7GF60_DUNSA|nr:hypothetical protein DUNSADRAFT_10482 [Dunaliella salina]|eukprot:KAF5833244.1 hypothetical protein DUNSADRAFT_10482 [Dunaliella salina]
MLGRLQELLCLLLLSVFEVEPCLSGQATSPECTQPDLDCLVFFCSFLVILFSREQDLIRLHLLFSTFESKLM